MTIKFKELQLCELLLYAGSQCEQLLAVTDNAASNVHRDDVPLRRAAALKHTQRGI